MSELEARLAEGPTWVALAEQRARSIIRLEEQLTAANSEIERLRAELSESETFRDVLRHQLDKYKTAARSACAKEMRDQGACNTQTDDLERWAFSFEAVQTLRVDAEAEVERLRALAEERWQLADERLTHIAAANALLERVNVWNERAGTDAELRTICSDVFDYLAGQAKEGEHPSEPSIDTLQQQVEYWRTEALAANELLRSVPHPESSAFPAWAKKADANLAGQAKAGPVSKLAANMAALGLHHIGESREDVVRRVAAPAQVQAEPECACGDNYESVSAPHECATAPDRTAAEQRVLRITGGASLEALEMAASVLNLLRAAELARRETV
jgi:hypothetical protein